MPVMVPFAKRLADIGTSQAHRDLVEDRYRELRRPRRVKFFVNGDRYFKGKKLFITPNRYFNFNDLLNDLTKKLPQNVYLPYGVRQIFTPLAGENIRNIEELQDGKSYVCAGFEPFKGVKYGNFELEPWSIARPHEQVSLDLSKDSGTPGRDQSNAFNPSRFFHSSLNSSRKYVPSFGLANRTSQNDNGYRRPKLITIVRYGPRPRNSIKLLLNRQSVMSFEQLLADIADSFGPKWENNKLRKLYTFRGKQVQGVSDFFRDDNIFIGVGTESVSDNDLQDILEELQPNNPHTKKLIRQWDKTKHRKTSQDGYLKFESEKLDSGFGSSDIGRKEAENNEKNNCTLIGDSGAGRAINYRSSRVNLEHQFKVNQNKDFRLVMRVDRERERAAYEERVRARKRQKKLKETEKHILDEERRRMNKQLGKDPMKKLKDDRRVGPVNENDLRQEKTQLQQSPRDKNEVSSKHQKTVSGKDSNQSNNNVVRGNTVLHESQNSLLLTPRSKLGYQVTNENVMERYELGRTLGYGNFAEVREAKQKNSNRDMALKIIDKQKLMGKEHMVESEIAILKICKHPNIVKLYEEFETSDRIYLAMELVKGGDLFDAITQSVKFREPDAAGMVKDLCNALFYLHSMKIVHRDLKPENLLVHWNKDGNMSLKLADFGLAMEVDEPIFTVCGTPTYVAPEILCQTGYGLEVDMWAIGVISFILLCGFPPFHSHDRCQSELFECIKTGEYEFLRPYWDDVSLHAKDLIEHLLLVDKEQRYKASQVLVHPWIICGGDINRILSGPELAEAQKTLHGQLDAEAKRNFEVFHRLREQMN